MSKIDLYKGDCLDVMDELIAKGVVVDAIITDPPYGTTACKWDSVIPFDEMWLRLNKLIKPNGAIVLFGSEPFSSALRMSNIKNYKYDWVWHKSKCGSAFTSKYRPQQKHEIISIFGKWKVNYYPQMREGEPYYRKRKSNKDGEKPNNHKLGVVSDSETNNKGERYPETVIYFQQKWRRQDQIHPTQKPVALMEYLIKTYTNEGELVLDFTMGSGTTGVACKNLGRDFIGIELDDKYFEIAKNRIENHKVDKGLFDE
ncbi:DNA-methyltransferase [Sulfurimonas sp.]|uniref:DNA-methyltransferase n=1 Tax=Sulfurimonas sp. TaxID=2022749 RepID=UPI003D13D8D2